MSDHGGDEDEMPPPQSPLPRARTKESVGASPSSAAGMPMGRRETSSDVGDDDETLPPQSPPPRSRLGASAAPSPVSAVGTPRAAPDTPRSWATSPYRGSENGGQYGGLRASLTPMHRHPALSREPSPALPRSDLGRLPSGTPMRGAPLQALPRGDLGRLPARSLNGSLNGSINGSLNSSLNGDTPVKVRSD
ncbi:unnamed protein product, partial [Phaeothamnion confervicola]